MKHKPQSIQNILSFYMSVLLLALLLAATVIFSVTQYLNVYSNNNRELQRLCNSIAENIDLQISQMDTICLNTIHSTLIKDTFHNYITDPSVTPYEKNQQRRLLANTLTSLKGVDSSIRQVNLYDMSEGSFGVGNFVGDLKINTPEENWFEPTKNAHGQKYIPPAKQNPLLSVAAGTDRGRYYLSLYRMYFDNYQHPAGFVEVMKYYDVLFEQAYAPNTDYDLDIVIYNKEGTILFPQNQHSTFPYLDYKASDKKQIYNTEKKCSEYVYFSDSKYSCFTIVTAIDRNQFLTPIYHTLLYILLVFFAALFVCLVLTTKTSKKLSAPLKRIYRFLGNIDSKNQFPKIETEETGVIELDKLQYSLNEAIEAQKTATDSIMLLKEQELQAQMLALQSQMNPHFLYNSLSTVAAMAQEGIIEPVVQMCEDITAILRYISSNKEPFSPLEDELEHCDLYLKCMKLRFGDSLQYQFDIDDKLLDFPIPKLCIQLLVENAVKFTTTQPAPWIVTIYGHLDDTCWYIGVRDNGSGFSQEKIRQLRTQMDEILKNGLLPSLAIDGMGILNIFIRFYLIYGHSFIFDFGNLPEGGAVVIVGGRFDEENKPL